MPVPDGNLLAIQLPNTSKSSADETTKSTLAVFKPPFKPQNNQTSMNTKD